jgi:hypothetical protein
MGAHRRGEGEGEREEGQGGGLGGGRQRGHGGGAMGTHNSCVSLFCAAVSWPLLCVRAGRKQGERRKREEKKRRKRKGKNMQKILNLEISEK